jgi:glycosyltransferase involved in cell wall biosynthesis
VKILFIADNFPPEVNAPATRTIEHCREWVRLGAEVTVITCAPNFPQGKVYPGYKNRLFQQEIMDGIEVIRVWSYITRNEGFVKRSLDYLSFAASASIAGLFQSTDVIVATSPQFFTTFAGYALSKLKQKPWVFELRDLWPESIRTVGAMGDSKILDILEKIELALYKNADVIVPVTEPFKRNLVSRGIPADKIEVVTNGANLNLYQPRAKSSELIAKHGLEGKFVVSYIGTHGMAHSLEFIADALDKVTDEEIHFLFIGDGAKKQDVMRLAREKNLKNATFLDPVPKELVPEYLSITDVALVPLLKSETFKTVIPSKIFEASAMRKPILLGVEGEAQGIVERYGAGLCFEPENELDFLAKLRVMKEDVALYQRLQQGCLILAEDYDRKRLALKMLDVFARSGAGTTLPVTSVIAGEQSR